MTFEVAHAAKGRRAALAPSANFYVLVQAAVGVEAALANSVKE